MIKIQLSVRVRMSRAVESFLSLSTTILDLRYIEYPGNTPNHSNNSRTHMRAEPREQGEIVFEAQGYGSNNMQGSCTRCSDMEL